MLAHREKGGRMATATYVAVTDGSKTLKFGQDIDEGFVFDADGVDAGVQSVLSFIATPSVDDADGDGALEMSVNGEVVLSQRFTSDKGRAWHETVKKNVLKAKDKAHRG
jgi:hypothetical protein